MKAADLRSMSVEDLQGKLVELQEAQLRMRCNKAIQQLENVSLLKHGKRDIARINTIINEKKRTNESQK